MKLTKSTWAAVGAALILAACGGGDGNGTQTSKVTFSSLVSFGDSLSDVGTYKVGLIASAYGGGKYTINSATDKNWTELIAAQLALPAPCAAETGLDGSTFGTALTFYSNCRNYAQGGSRVTNPIGIGNKNIPASAALGQLTIPVVTQVSRHLGVVGGAFSGTELVTVMAGGNDGIMAAETYVGTMQFITAGAGGAAAAAAASPSLVATANTTMTTAGTELAALIKTQILAKGAKYVLVVNLPNLGVTPYATAEEAKIAGSRAIIANFSAAFNTALQAGLAGTSNVKIVDAYTIITDQVANPAQYALTNATSPACNLASPGNPLGSSLVCSAANTNAGDVSHYLFADSVHGTPYAYKLLAQLVSKDLAFAGWL
jgi:phospholipase/lecithinase/hemolysin